MTTLNTYIKKMNKDGEGFHFERYDKDSHIHLIISPSRYDSPLIDLSRKDDEDSLIKGVTGLLISTLRDGIIFITATEPDYRQTTQIIRDADTTIKRHAEHLKSEGDIEGLQVLKDNIEQHIKTLKDIKALIEADTEEEEGGRFVILKREAEEAEERKTIKERQETGPGTIYNITQEVERRIEAVRYQTTPTQELNNIIKEFKNYLKHLKN